MACIITSQLFKMHKLEKTKFNKGHNKDPALPNSPMWTGNFQEAKEWLE